MEKVNYPGYIGFENQIIQAIKIKLKYAGGTEKRYIINQGSLVSIGHMVNNNGSIEYKLTLGLVKRISSEAIRGAGYSEPRGVYLEVDISEQFGSNIEVIYVNDIRDLTVATVGDNYAINRDIIVDRLPEVNDANIDLYAGKIFWVKENYNPNPNDPELWRSKGMYTYIDKWMAITCSNDIVSSPLISSLDLSNPEFPVYQLLGDISINGKQVKNEQHYALEKPTESILAAYNNSESKMSLANTGICWSYYIRLVGVVLPGVGIDTVAYADNDEYDKIKIAHIKHISCIPEFDTAAIVNKAFDSVNNSLVDVYHNVSADGYIYLNYPKSAAAGIKELILSGTYHK